MRILGALGEGASAPLVGLLVDGAEPRRCVLHAASAPVEGVMLDLGAAGRRLLVPWREGPDLAGLLEHEDARILWTEAIARARPLVGEGTVSLDEVRFDRSGRASLVPAREPEVERRPLAGWVEELSGAPEPHRAPERFEQWCAEAASAEPVLLAHPLSGQLLSLQRPPDADHGSVPAKVRVATFAGVTLALGLASGWVMRPVGPAMLTVVLDAVGEVVVDCGSGELSWRGAGEMPMVPVRGRCRVDVRPESGGSLSTHLDVGSSGRYECAPTEGDLTCFAL